jgi:murein DD-endopeptidase MepM/ murein hydrolase activator NlpD
MRNESARQNSGKEFFTIKREAVRNTDSLSAALPNGSNAKKNIAPLRLNLGFAEISYQGKGQFIYFYRRAGVLKSGFLRIDRRAATWLALGIFCLGVSAGLMLWKKRQNAVRLAFALNKTGVGGVGRLESGKIINEAADIIGEIAQFEEDEKIKNQLMGVIEERSAESEAAEKQATKVQKLKYKVKPGDTLQSIAKKYKVKPESISGSSRLDEFQDISVGQTLSIPTRDGIYYIVKKNERLANILQAHKVSLDKFIAENEHVNIDLLDAGEEIFLPGAKPIRRAEGWLIPVASRVVTSGYGWRNWPRAAFHKGVDLKAFYVPVRAAKSGIVTYSGWLGGYGNAIIIQHDDTYKTLYAHLSRRHVAVGQRVRRGQVIGRTGDTGYSFGPHLHFEISKNGENVNPIKFLKGLRGRSKKR